MATASFYTGLIGTTAGYVRTPIFYYDDWSESKPPFAVTGSESAQRVSVTNVRYTQPSNFIKINETSPFVIINNGVYNGKWADLMNNIDGQEHKVLTLKNGNYISAKAVPAVPPTSSYFEIYLYDPYDTLLASFNSIRYNLNYETIFYNGITFLKAEDGTLIFEHHYIRTYNYGSFTIYLSTPGTAAQAATFNTFINGSALDTDNPYGTAPESDSTGGYGDFNYSGDPIGFPTLPTLSAANSGFVTLFTPTITQIQDLCNYMWSDGWDIATNFRKIFADPMDCILSLGIVPVTPVQEAAPKEIMVGNISTGVSSNYTSHQFYVQNMGVIHIDEQTKSNMDYSPYTKAELYLPFIGSRPVNIDDIMSADLELCYYIDLLSGACTAIMTVTKYNSDGSLLDSALYNYSGNCLANIPITSQNFTQMYQAIIGAATVAMTAGAGAGMIAGAAAANLTHSTKLKSDITKSGNMSGSSGFMGVKKPYITITYPNICNVRNSNEVLGTPAFIGLGKSENNMLKLSDFSGFTKMYKVDVTGIPCTTAERELIEAALLEGVIL